MPIVEIVFIKATYEFILGFQARSKETLSRDMMEVGLCMRITSCHAYHCWSNGISQNRSS